MDDFTFDPSELRLPSVYAIPPAPKRKNIVSRQDEDDGKFYDYEVRDDGSVWLNGETGRKAGGTSILIQGPPTPDAVDQGPPSLPTPQRESSRRPMIRGLYPEGMEDIDPPDKTSQPGQRFAASVVNSFTSSIPETLGIAGAVGKTGYDLAKGGTRKEDEDSLDWLGRIFMENANDGYSGALTSLGSSSRNAINKAFNVEKPPETSIDHVMDVAGAFSSIPTGVAKTLPKAANMALEWLTPYIKAGEGFKSRYAGQAGLVGGLEYLMHPEEKPKEEKVAPVPIPEPEKEDFLSQIWNKMNPVGSAQAATIDPNEPIFDFDQQALEEEAFASNPPAFDYQAFQDEQTRVAKERDRIMHEKELASSFWTNVSIGGGAAFLAAAAKMANDMRKSRLAKYAPSQTAPFGIPAPPNTLVQDALEEFKNAPTLTEKYGVFKTHLQDGINNIHGQAIDKMSILERYLKNAGFSDETIEKTLVRGQMNPRNMARQFWEDRILPGQRMRGGMSLREMDAALQRLPEDKRIAFGEAIDAQNTQHTRIRATAKDVIGTDAAGNELIPGMKLAYYHGSIDDVSSLLQSHALRVAQLRKSGMQAQVGLWRYNYPGAPHQARPYRDSELDQLIQDGKNDPDLGPLIREYYKMGDELLTFTRAQHGMDDVMEKDLRARFTENGLAMYSPGMKVTEMPGIVARVAADFGWGTSASNELEAVGNLMQRASEDGEGLKNMLGPVEAMKMYSLKLMEEAARSNFQWEVVSKLAEVTIGDKGVSKGKIVRLRPFHQVNKEDDGYASTRIRYVGSFDPRNPDNLKMSRDSNSGMDNPNTVIEWTDDAEIRKKYQVDAEDKSLKLDTIKNAMTIKRDGVLHFFDTPDMIFRAALENGEDLTGLMRLMSKTKSMVQQGSTGILAPIFAPISSMYSTWASAFVTLTREATLTNPFAGMHSYLDSAKGVANVLATDMAKIFSDNMAEALSHAPSVAFMRDNGIIDMAKMQAKFQRYYEDSLLTLIRRDSGGVKISDSFGSHERPLLNQLAGHSRGVPGSWRGMAVDDLQTVGKLFLTLDRALREGPAVGVMIRELAKKADPTQEDVLLAKNKAKLTTGDHSMVGAHGAAEFIDKTAPYSSPLIQSFDNMARAIKANPAGVIPALMGTVGIPAIGIAAWNADVAATDVNEDGTPRKYADAKGREWTHDEWLSELPASFRVSNHIILHHGEAPWNSQPIPIEPALIPAHVAFMAALNAFTEQDKLASQGISGIEPGYGIAGANRALSVSSPTLLQLFAIHLGARVNFGPSEVAVPNEGLQISFINKFPQSRGQNFTGNAGTEAFVDAQVGIHTKSILQTIMGGVADTIVAGAEGFKAGRGLEKELVPSVLSGVDRTMDEIGASLKKRNSYLGAEEAGRPSENTSVYRNLLVKTDRLSRLQNDKNSLITGGYITIDGHPLQGNSIIPSNDPVYQAYAATAPVIIQSLSQYDKNIAALRAENVDLAGSNRSRDGKVLSVYRRDRLIDANVSHINLIRATMYAKITAFEEMGTKVLSERFNRPIKVDLSKVVARPNEDVGIPKKP